MGIQLSGIDTLFYYSTLVLRSAQIPQPQLASTLLGLLNAIMTLVAIWAVAHAGFIDASESSWVGRWMFVGIATFQVLRSTGASETTRAVVTLSFLVIVVYTWVSTPLVKLWIRLVPPQ